MKRVILSVLTVLVLGGLGCYFFMPAALFGLSMKLERNLGGLGEHTVGVNGMTVHYLEGGKGEPLVLIHGFGAHKDNWTRIARHLTPHFRVIAPDLPGFGETGREPEGRYAIRDQALFIKAFLSALGISSCHMGGNSMGGNIAGQYAALFPETLKGLFLLAPGGVATAQPSEMFQMLEKGEPLPLVVGSAKEFNALLDFVFEEVPFIPGPVKNYLTEKAIQNRALNLEIFEILKDRSQGEPMETLVKGMRVKTLVLWGEKDRVLHPGGAEVLGRIVPDSKVIILDNVGHVPMVEAPERTATAYLEFLGLIKGGESG